MGDDCWATWRAQGAPISDAGSIGVSRRLGQAYAAVMPILKAYALSLGFSQVVDVGYIGVSGGTRWGQRCTRAASAVFRYACSYQAALDRPVQHGRPGGLHPQRPQPRRHPSSGVNPRLSALGGLRHGAKLRLRRQHSACLLPPMDRVEPEPLGFDLGRADRQQYPLCDQRVECRRVDNGSDVVGMDVIESSSELLQPVARHAAGKRRHDRGWHAVLGRGVCFELASNSDTGSGRYYNLVNEDGTTPPWYTTFSRMSNSRM